MKRLVLALLIASFVTLPLAALWQDAAPATGAAAAPPGPSLPQDHVEEELCGGIQAPNMLHNPSFEGPYSAYIPPGGHQDCPTGICNSAQMADGWTPYWLSRLDTTNKEIRNPEYKPAELWHVPGRVHSGSRAQQLFTSFSFHEGGFYQRVNVTPGALYCFGIWGHAWSTETDNPYFNDSELEQAIGIDPTGGTDWRSANIIWGGPKQYYYDDGEESAYGPFTLVVRAASSQLTVFTWSRPVWAVKHNDVYWDDATLLRAPHEPTLTLSRNEIAILEHPAQQGQYEIPVDISFTNDPGMIWRASLQPGNTLDVALSAPAGTALADLTITFDSAPYAPGSYYASILVQADPHVPGSPQTIDVGLHIFENIHRLSLPLVTN